jgi:uncharacterized repeat protein (TIGR03803 family)
MTYLRRALLTLASPLACALALAAPRYDIEPLQAASLGARPGGRLAAGADGALYGTAEAGGPNGDGTIFRVDTQGGMTLLHAFDGADGFSPLSPPTALRSGTLAGTTQAGGTTGAGIVYRLGPARDR